MFGTVSVGWTQDVVRFHNGDILTGKVVARTDEIIRFEGSSCGLVELKIADIEEIRNKESKEVPVPAVLELPAEKKTTSPKTDKSPWSGQAGLSMAIRESNTLRDSGTTSVEQEESFESYRLYGNLIWKGKCNDLRWDWTYRYSRTDLRKNDDFLNLVQNYKHYFDWKNLFASVKTEYKRDFRRKVENEYLQTAEMGVNWFDSEYFKLTTSAGGGFHQSERLVYNSVTMSNEEETFSEPKLVLNESIRWQVIQSLALIQKYTHLSDFDNYQMLFSAGLENKLIHDLFLRVEYRLDRDTEYNQEDRIYTDRALLTSLLYKF
ncbi:MAG TPA: DUF481 domain-containing protein [Pontiella sp.]